MGVSKCPTPHIPAILCHSAKADFYTFFYALHCALLLLYFFPFIRQFYHEKKSSAQLFIKILWIPLAIIVCLSRPLNPGAVLIFSMLVILAKVIINYFNSTHDRILNKVSSTITAIPKSYWFFLLPVSLLSVYSLILGRYNSITIATQIPLGEMYLKLPEGIYYQFTQKPGFPVLFLIMTSKLLF